jgi:hypothetical protein
MLWMLFSIEPCRSPPAAVDKEKQNVGEEQVVDPDVVVMARAYKQDDLDDAMD